MKKHYNEAANQGWRVSLLQGLKLCSLLLLTCFTFNLSFGQSVVDRYGRLQVANAHVCSESGEQISLAGNSFFWSNWSGKFYNANTVNYLANEMGSSIVRAAMAVSDDGHPLDGGYLKDEFGAKGQVQTVVDAAINNGIYVIIDWHVEGDTRAYLSQAKKFFGEMAQQYGHQPNVIYEIWNEPTHTNWGEIRPYAVEVVNAIRAHDPDNLIIVGTETWSQRPDDASLNPIPDNNIAYTIHFYPEDANIGQFHRETLRQNCLTAMNNGAAIFATEWGPSDSAPNPEADIWMDFLKEHKISHCMWSVNDKLEDGDWQWSIFNATSGSGGYSLRGPGIYLKSLMDSWPWPSDGPIECGELLLPGRVEAENYCTQLGTQTETTEDPQGGNLNVGYVDNGDWLEYEVTVGNAGTYEMDFRVAADGTETKTFSVLLNGTTLTNVSFTATGGWQNWTTVSASAGLPAGVHKIRLAATSDGFNINFIDFSSNCTQPDLQDVEITTGSTTIAIGESVQLAARGVNGCGGNVAIAPVWSGNAPNGLFIASVAGTFDVSVSAGGFSDQVTITVAAENATLISNAERNERSLMDTKWFSYHDNGDGGASSIVPFATDANPFTMSAGGANGTNNGTKISYTLNQGSLEFDPYVGFGFDMKEDQTAYDLSGATGISFFHKGTACTIAVPLASNTDPDYYSASIPAHANWTKVTINWSQLAQSADWGEDVAWNAAQILKFQWQVSGASGQSGDVWIDEVKVEGLTFTTPLDPNPCSDNTLASIALSPANVTIGLNQSVTFTASGASSCQSVAINPSWSANAPNGVFTSGNQEGTFTVTATQNGIVGSATVTVVDEPVVAPGLIQAENFASVEGEVEIENGGDGSPNVGFFDAGEKLHYAVNVTQAFNAKVSLRVATATGGDLVLGADGNDLMRVDIPSTGDWTNWATVVVSLNFPASSDFYITTNTGAVNINWADIVINDCATPGLATLTVTPSAPKIMPNQSVQLYAAGTDGCGVNTAVNATWSANAPNGFFQAGAAEGLETVTVTAGGITETITIEVANPSKKKNFMVNHHGRLQVGGNQVFGKHGNVVSLAGNSLFWSGSAPIWYSNETVEWLVDDWNTQIIRAVISINPKDKQTGLPWNDKDYVQSPEYTMNLVKEVINAAIENDIYVIVDFHEHHSDQYTQEAIELFTEIAATYNGYDNIIYELWNEPLDHGSWPAVKNHANQVIPAIRAHDPDNLIVVGTPFFSQDVDDAAADPINDNNVAYALHGYAIEGAHGALRKSYGVPVVGTEWGINVNENGGGETGAWVDYWRNHNGGLIHCLWSVNNKHVDGDQNWSILNTGVTSKGSWTDQELSTSGHFQKSVIQGWTAIRPEPISCENEVLTGITVSPESAQILLGESLQLSVTGVTSCGNTAAVNPTWSANAPGGVFNATTEGVFTVTVSANGFTASATITVTDGPTGEPVVIEAESYAFMDGVQTEDCSEGGLNVGWLDAGDWMAYPGISVPTTGTYLVEYRVASENGGGQLKFEENAGQILHGTMNIPATGGWQNWTTVSQTITLTAGSHDFGVGITQGGFNINWIRLTPMGNARLENSSSAEATAETLSIFPVPATSQLNIKGLNASAQQITVMDLQGKVQMVIDLKADQSAVKLDISSLDRGVYLLNIKGMNSNYRQKFVKQ